MPESDDIPGNITKQVADVVRELTRELNALDIEDRQTRVAAGHLIAQAAMAGAKIGAAEVAAQLIEHGVDVRLELMTDDDSWGAP